MFILIILFSALVVRLLYFIDYGNTKIYPILRYSDGDFYYGWARDIAGGDILGNKVFMKWPLYAYILALLLKISKNSVSAVYGFQFMLGAINCILVYFIAKEMFSRIVAFIAALLCVWYALFIFYDGLLTYNSLSLFLNSVLFLLILNIQNHPNIKNLFLIGIFLGLCTIAQTNIIIFGVLAVAWILRQKKLSLARSAYVFSCFIAGLSIILGTVVLRNYLVAKDLVLISGNIGVTFYSGNNPDSDGTFSPPFLMTRHLYGMNRDAKIITNASLNREAKTSEVSNFWFHKSLNFIKNEPGRYTKLLIKKFIYLFSPKEFILDPEYDIVIDKIRVLKIMFLDLRFTLPFIFLGFFLNAKRFKGLGLLYLIIASFSISIILFFVASRYRLAMIPFLMIFASSGILVFWDAIKKRSFLRLTIFIAAISILFVLFNDKRLSTKHRASWSKENLSNFSYYIAKSNYYTINLDYQDALRFAKLAYAIEPNNPEVTFSLANAYYDMKEFSMAEDKFRETIRILPLSVDAYYNLGLLYIRHKRFEEAVEVLEKAIALDPEDTLAHFELGKAYKTIGNPKRARDQFNFALKKLNRWRTEDREIIEKELGDLNR